MNKTPVDADARRRIVEDLDRTFFVEAGAGSGKTKSLVDRMIALLEAGRCEIGTLAAVTFTRKAAAELRGRFQIRLEQGAADPGLKEDARKRLALALQNLERCTIGTIHSFCARLLRERPLEIGLDPGFTEMEEIEDSLFRDQCWLDYLVRVRIEGQEILQGLDDVGIPPEELKDAFDSVSSYPDVEIAGGRRDVPDYAGIRESLEEFLSGAKKALPKTKPEKGCDGLQALVQRCLRRQRILKFDDHRVLMETLDLIGKGAGLTQNRWPSKEAALAFKAAFDSYREGTAAPALKAWREYRHDKIVRFLGPALDFYASRRKEESRLNYEDLLMQAARLLRDNPEVRRYFGRKFSHVLVDEFQDTDPIQAEMLMYLKGTDTGEKDWQSLRPAPGSLFLVGDPKQSIYRFRRADIDIYNRVGEMVKAAGGGELNLTSNFRSLRPLADWNNPVFRAVLPVEADRYQARFAPIETVRDDEAGCAAGVYKVVVPAVGHNKKAEIAALDAGMIAGWIRWACGGGVKLARSPEEKAKGLGPAAQPSDFLVLFREKKNMDVYARALENLGIPFEISGSDAFSGSVEVREITNLATALDDPDDPVYTVAALRGIFCGVSDADLAEFHREGGRFNFLTPGRDLLESRHLGFLNVSLGLQRLKAWRDITLRLPASAALHRILEESGILNYLASQDMGSSKVGNVLKLLEIVRSGERKGETSFSAVVKLLEELVEVREIEEISLTPARADAVRLMNLHKAKGLEAPIVFLANPGPLTEHAVDKHVVRVSETGMRSKPKGYFVFCRRDAFGRPSNIFSQPADWEKAAEEEKRYQAAEQIRLMYVAATRAKNMLVVSTYAGNARLKPWMTIDEALAGVPELAAAFPGSAPSAAEGADGGPGGDEDNEERPRGIVARKREIAVITTAEVDRARKEIGANIRQAGEPSYAVESVTALAGKDKKPGERRGPGFGPVWGRLVHRVLEAVGSGKLNPKDLDLFLENILAAEESDFADKAGLRAHVEAILGSPFWARVIKADKRYFEIPFAIKTDEAALGVAGTDNTGIPVILRGTIDLVFREGEEGGRKDKRGGGWVIADYKTDRIPLAVAALESSGRSLGIEQARAMSPEFAAAVDRYSPQVRLYGRFWQQITGERVIESGLYFTSIDRWVKVPLSA